MNTISFLKQAASSSPRRALPLLSFPGAGQMNIRVDALVNDAALYADTICYVAEHTPALAAVCPMDLSVEAEAFGAKVRFEAEEVPAVIDVLVSDIDETDQLQIPELDKGRIPICLEGIRIAKQRISDKPLFAGMIGPYSLAGRLMDVTEIMYYCYDEPEAVETVLKKATEFLIKYGTALKDAGADGIVIAEPLAGVLSPDMADKFSMPYVKRMIDALQEESFAIIYHNCGNSVSQMLPSVFSLGASGYHFGNAVNMAEILKRAPENVICMGNLDPTEIFVSSSVAEVTAAAEKLMADCGKYNNYIPSSGCDIPYQAKWENILAFFKAI